MKKIAFFAVLALGLVACNDSSELQVGQYTKVEVEKNYNAGTVAKGEIVEADIVLKNVGDYPLVIADIKAACSCTVSEFEEDPIAPGESTVIKATVDTDKTGRGKVVKPITITANTRPSTTEVKIHVNVIN